MTAQEAAASPELPQVFGRYLLLKRLSRGGMGEILLAKLGEIQGFEKLVIIKKILPNLAADQEFIKRFIDEAQVAIKLTHANIAPVFEVGKVDGEYFLAIEYVEGRDLRRTISRLREQKLRLPVDLCLYVVRELAAGLAYAHRKTDENGKALSLVHCDISPPNVMLSFEGEVKVIDFGIAKSAIRLAASNPNMGFGKFGYMAPEQLIRGGQVDRRTDLYAAGVLLYELLTGDRLFSFPEGTDYRQIARTVTGGKFPPPSARDPRLGTELDSIVMRALAPKKDDRYQTAEELRDAIQGKLSQINPTISGDALAGFLRQLFQDEITEERELLAHMKAVDMTPFVEELTQATIEHTVTFARASAPAKARAFGNSGPIRVATVEQLKAHPKRRFAFFIGGTLMMALGGGSAVWYGARPTPPIVTSAPPPATAAPAPAVAPRPAASPVPVPVPVPIPTPVSTPLPRPRPAPAAPSHKDRRHHTVAQAPPPHVESAAQHRSPEAVQRKFRTVTKEYAAFKSQYGPVLEERWNAIATEITYGKGEKVDKVDAMLDELRKEMTKVRGGG